jgi:hypothetical protein
MTTPILIEPLVVIKPPAVANDKVLDPQTIPPIRASTHEAAMSTSLLFLLHSSSSLENPCDLNILTLPSVSEAAPLQIPLAKSTALPYIRPNTKPSWMLSNIKPKLGFASLEAGIRLS